MGSTGQILLLLPAQFSENSEIKLRADFDPFYKFRIAKDSAKDY